ncbi:MAG: hypothetical protein ACRYFX_18695 [Janthinobacterium lividum]
MPRLEPNTPLLDITIHSHPAGEDGRELKYLVFQFGTFRLTSHLLDADQVNYLLRGFISGASETEIPIPIEFMGAMCIPKQLRHGLLTLEKVNPRRSF